MTYNVGNMPRLFVVTQESFWRVYDTIREHHKGGVSWKMLEMLTSVSLDKRILCPACMIEPEDAFIIGAAFRWKHSHSPPWSVYPDCDRAAMENLCGQVWNAQAVYEREEAERLKRESKKREGQGGRQRGRR